MGASFTSFAISVAVATIGVVFVMYPPPPLTESLQKWKDSGSFFKYNTYNIFYRVEKGGNPDGDDLLIFHGFPTSTYDWTKVLQAGIHKDFKRVILFDMLGFGFSDKPKSYEYSIMEQADIAEKLLDKLGINEFHVLAHDYGDTVALETLARYNQKQSRYKIKSVCLSNGGVFPETNFPRPIQKILTIPYIGAVLPHLTSFAVFRKGFGDIFGPKTQPTESDQWEFYTLMRQKDGNLVQNKLLRYIAERSEHKDRWVGALIQSSIPGKRFPIPI